MRYRSRRPPTIPSAVSRIRALGLRGGGAGARAQGLFFDTDHRLLGDRFHAGRSMIAGFADREPRRRILGIDGSATIPQTRGIRSPGSLAALPS